MTPVTVTQGSEGTSMPSLPCTSMPSLPPVTVTQGSDGIEVQGARGRPATDTYKVGATYLDGYKATAVCMIGGNGAAEKARITGEATVERVNRLLEAAGGACFPRVNVQGLGAEDTYGAHTRGTDCREAVLWLSVQHADKRAVELFAREIAAAGTGGLPGLVGGRPRPSPVLRLHSALIPKGEVKMRVTVGDHSEDYTEAPGPARYADSPAPHHPGVEEQGVRTYKLSELAVARSGDKGDSCNIAVAARGPEAWPAIWPTSSRRVSTPRPVCRGTRCRAHTRSTSCCRGRWAAVAWRP